MLRAKIRRPFSIRSPGYRSPGFARKFPGFEEASGIKTVWRFAGVCAIGLAVVLAAVAFDSFRKKENVALQSVRADPVERSHGSLTTISSQRQLLRGLPRSPLLSPHRLASMPSAMANPINSICCQGERDIRVAISPLITTNSRTTLPDGHLTFIVYRRDSVTNAADRAEVRVVARIARELSFDKDGKQVASKLDDNWVIRNISIPYRTAPKKDIPDMYEIQSENPGTPLAPGR